MSLRNIIICGRILTQFTGLLLTNTVATKRDLLAERTGLGNQFQYLTQFTGLLLTNTVATKRDLLAERTGLGNQFQYRSVTPVAGLNLLR